MQEKQNFEEGWKKAFDGAKMTPPDSIWNSIELELASQESAAMKKKVVFYQGLAAAMLVFALMMGAYAFWPADEVTGLTNVTKGRNEEEVTGKDGKTTEERNEAGTTNKAFQPILKERDGSVQQQIALVVETNNKDEQQEQAGIIHQGEEQKQVEKQEEKEDVVDVVAPQILEQGPDVVVETKHSKKQSENLWLALGGSAGNYTPNTPTATTPGFQPDFSASLGPRNQQFFTTAAQPVKPQPKVGTAYTVGVGVGKKFGRVIIQTGLNIIKQQINYSSNYYQSSGSNVAKAAVSDYATQSNALSYTNEYTVNSTMETLSIPLQAGYMIIDRKLGWQINAGVSNDIFLRNVLVDKSGQREKSIENAGSGSPYRSFNWSGLASTELSYRIGQHYRLSLVPGARYSFNSILKNATDNGRPVVLDVGFRFRYIFE